MRVVRDAVRDDAAAVAAIYNHYVLHTAVTFEESAVTEPEMAERLAEGSAQLPFLVAEESGRIAAFAYASTWKGRCAYRFSREVTVYARDGAGGQGLGSALYTLLLARLREHSVHAALAGIALPNEASVAFHEKFGFAQVAHLREVGRKFDRWVDVGYWQLML